MSTKRPRSFWEQLAAEAERDGVAAVARRHRVNRRTLAWWRWRLAHEPRLLPVVVEPAAMRAPQTVEIAVGVVRLRIDVGTEVGYVADLVHALARC